MSPCVPGNERPGAWTRGAVRPAGRWRCARGGRRPARRGSCACGHASSPVIGPSAAAASQSGVRASARYWAGGARGNLKWLTGCWRLASWGPRRWGRGRSAQAGRPRRQVSARRAGLGSRLRRGAYGPPDAGALVAVAAARVPDVRVGRRPGRLPFSPPRPTPASWGLEGVGPGGEFPPRVSVRRGFRGSWFHFVSGVRGGGDRAPLPERRDRSLGLGGRPESGRQAHSQGSQFRGGPRSNRELTRVARLQFSHRETSQWSLQMQQRE